ncbi:MAG: hypothetical protein A2583_14275 [Bdellovibrionales bacterium RIFOXYD1_FULL_53_11]|nr:MAG: hypothetical protein A2583_14275 [Bdellovibrionales bacterium RIFOXYD1_FULL_53_11]
MKNIRLEPRPSWRDLFPVADVDGSFGKQYANFCYTGSGKSAISLILQYLRETGTLENKMSAVAVPDWLGVQVYQQIQLHSFALPARIGAPCRAALVYHQYGFPQDMNRIMDHAAAKKMIVIEDCAHACASTYKGRPLGSIGDYAVFSFSKFVFCGALGGIACKDAGFQAFVDHKKNGSSRLLCHLINGIKHLDEWNLSRNKPLLPVFMSAMRTAFYSQYGISHRAACGSVSLWKKKRQAEMALRQKRYKSFRATVDAFGICDHLEADGITPYAIPVIIGDDKRRALVHKLNLNGYHAGVYRFDAARFMFEPRFVECILLPCHSGISDRDFDTMTGIIVESL